MLVPPEKENLVTRRSLPPEMESHFRGIHRRLGIPADGGWNGPLPDHKGIGRDSRRDLDRFIKSHELPDKADPIA